eukprot:UN04807
MIQLLPTLHDKVKLSVIARGYNWTKLTEESDVVKHLVSSAKHKLKNGSYSVRLCALANQMGIELYEVQADILKIKGENDNFDLVGRSVLRSENLT